MTTASVTKVHLPAHNPLNKHFAFVSSEIDLQKVNTLLYDERLLEATYMRTINAGVYGFKSKETRDRFISMLNGSSEIEVAYIASITPLQGL